MKAIILSAVMMVAANAMAFEVQLDNEGMAVDELVKAGATTVSCKDVRPKCILIKNRVGIQYPEQTLEEVAFTHYTSNTDALNSIKEIKSAGLCE
ncbi:MAG: hypothetical protein CL676_02485 [Bdellovibrionaceae bacterium]|nr:hypothetical protein [Pseudobdellovibrionaceae bacterium]|tara:strand:- start:2621 stop:2905 length:285 start_codon:yes stop_codon:yes gene_type:complete